MMDKNTFEAWMDEVMPWMVQMSRSQTETFFTHFTKSCSREQRAYLETQFSHLLMQDFMLVPTLPRIKILNHLNIRCLLNLRLVSKSWEEAVTNLSVFWKLKCQKLPIRVDQNRCLYETHRCYFNLFVASQRVLHKLSTGGALRFRDIPLSLNKSRSGMCVNHLLAYGDNVIVIGSKERMLMAVDATSGQILWELTCDSPSCLCISSDLILAGTYLGAIKVHSLDRSCSTSFQCGATAVTALDVHESGRFVIVASSDGSLRLVDEELKIQGVHLQSHLPTLDGVIQKVYFLPDSSLSTGQLAVCLCRQCSRSVAVFQDSGEVLFQEDCKFDSDAFSFCRSCSEPHALFLSTRRDEPGVEGYFEKHTFHIESSRISTHVWRADINFTQPMDSLYRDTPAQFGKELYILAAGKELCIAAAGNSLQVFRILCGTKVYTHSHFFERDSISKLQWNQETGRVLTVHTSWLDGLSPSTTLEKVPIVLFSMVASWNHRPLIRTLIWAPKLWGNFKDGIQCESQNADWDDTLDQSDGVQGANARPEISENLDCDNILDHRSKDGSGDVQRELINVGDVQQATASLARSSDRMETLCSGHASNVAAMEVEKEKKKLVSHGDAGQRNRTGRPLGVWSNGALFKQKFCHPTRDFPEDCIS